MKRRIINKLRIDEISAVDEPCQHDAKMSIMKRHAPPSHEAEADMVFNLDKFERRIEEVRKTEPGLSYTAAMTKARQRFPEDFRRYCAAPVSEESVADSAEIAKRTAVNDFEGLVDHYRAQNRCSRTAAMTAIRKSHPEAFEAYQSL